MQFLGLQRACAWAGPVFVVFFLVGFLLLAGFVPPHEPTMSAEAVAKSYADHHITIILGFAVCMLGVGLTVPWGASLAVQIARIEGGFYGLSMTTLVAGCLSNFLFLPCFMFWVAAAYRPERDPQLILLLNDMAWIALVMMVSMAVIQCVAMGLAILNDKRAEPILPRWAGYFNFWVAVLFMPGTVNALFKTGPFAWNGFFVFWLPLVVFTVWILVNTAVVLKALGAQARATGSVQAVAA